MCQSPTSKGENNLGSWRETPKNGTAWKDSVWLVVRECMDCRLAAWQFQTTSSINGLEMNKFERTEVLEVHQYLKHFPVNHSVTWHSHLIPFEELSKLTTTVNMSLPSAFRIARKAWMVPGEPAPPSIVTPANDMARKRVFVCKVSCSQECLFWLWENGWYSIFDVVHRVLLNLRLHEIFDGGTMVAPVYSLVFPSCASIRDLITWASQDSLANRIVQVLLTFVDHLLSLPRQWDCWAKCCNTPWCLLQCERIARIYSALSTLRQKFKLLTLGKSTVAGPMVSKCFKLFQIFFECK